MAAVDSTRTTLKKLRYFCSGVSATRTDRAGVIRATPMSPGHCQMAVLRSLWRVASAHRLLKEMCQSVHMNERFRRW